MNKYTIYCTEEQTKKAIELGASISNAVGMANIVKEKYFADGKGNFIILPTAEQMIGFLLDNGITDMVISRKNNPHTFGFNIWYGMNGLIQEEIQYPSRPEATLAAIDAALEYLEGQKNIM